MSRAAGLARLLAWIALVLAFGGLAFAQRAQGVKPPRDYFYDYGNAAGGLIQYAFVLGVALLIAMRLGKRSAFALRRPSSWALAVGLAFGLFVALLLLGATVRALGGDPRAEQGLAPTYWNGDEAVAFACNLAIASAVAPIVEELLFRGLGCTLFERFGRVSAITLVGLFFGLWHGLVIALPLLAAFGAGLAFIRYRTGSIYPGIVLHGVSNTLAVVVPLAA